MIMFTALRSQTGLLFLELGQTLISIHSKPKTHLSSLQLAK